VPSASERLDRIAAVLTHLFLSLMTLSERRSAKETVQMPFSVFFYLSIFIQKHPGSLNENQLRLGRHVRGSFR